MKILLCTGIYPPEPGGPATYTKLLAEELVKRGHMIKVITYSTPTLSPPYQGGDEEGVVRISRSWFKPLHYFRYFRMVKKLGKNFDVLYAQDPVSAGYPTYLAARVLKKPYVVKATGDYSWEQAMGRKLTTVLIDEFQKLPHYPFWIKLMRRIQIQVCKEANLVIVPSEYLRRLVMGWGIKEKKLHVIYNASLDVPSISRELHGGFRTVSVGRDVKWKGFEMLREAAAELQKEIPDLKLEILQNTPREIVLERLAAADVFVLNSAYEGTSHVILEAMALGTPVVTTRVGGNSEIVTPGVGILVEFNNKEEIKEAIRELYHDPSLRQRLAAAATRMVKQKFSLDGMISETLAVLKFLIPNS
ncbi:MAG: glycosyltransferase family 4 protein [Candidatus Doudnabacteria bacterium]|nr:glycosyltransferase family 4 protein [Candidatus Doudnabacteria bacterium]